MKKRSFAFILVAILICSMLSGCASLGSAIQTLKGELIGNSYPIWEYDNFGNRILTLSGDKIALEGGVDSNGEATSYVDITVDEAYFVITYIISNCEEYVKPIPRSTITET